MPLNLFLPDYCRAISLEAEPRSSGWSWVLTTRVIAPLTPKRPACWWERARRRRAHRVCTAWLPEHIIINIKTKILYLRSGNLFISPQSFPTDLTSSRLKTPQTGSKHYGELTGLYTNTVSHLGELWLAVAIQSSSDIVFCVQISSSLSEIIKYNSKHVSVWARSVQMNRFFRKDSHLTCLEKVCIFKL